VTTKDHLDPARRHDFVLLFDVTDGNPNGDPDNGNAPRMDPETGIGWVTDAALKRKVRNFVLDAHPDEDGYGIYVREGIALNQIHREAYEELGIKGGKKKGQAADTPEKAQQILCRKYFDIRTFGAVLSVGENPAGQVRGPIQMTMAESVDPILPTELTITRVTVTREEDLAKFQSGEGGKEREMGTKQLVPYALFRSYGFFTPSLAKRTGFDGDDLEVFWDALRRMWSLDRSASRGMTGCRGVHVFTHADAYGSCHPDKLFRRVSISRRRAGEATRTFDDYAIDVDLENLPDGVTHTLLDW